jgi:hypothetical protein
VVALLPKQATKTLKWPAQGSEFCTNHPSFVTQNNAHDHGFYSVPTGIVSRAPSSRQNNFGDAAES